MDYKIAVGSSDGIHIDLKFGEVKKFLIYKVSDEISLSEERIVYDDTVTEKAGENNCNEGGCSGRNCGAGGCSGFSDVISKVALLADCRCIVCKKIGFQAQKQLEKRAISVFDVECTIEEALEKITFYYGKVDKHQSFRA